MTSVPGVDHPVEQTEAEVTLTFTTPALPDDLDVLSRPATYLTADVRAADGRAHAISLYFDASALLAVNVSLSILSGGPAYDLVMFVRAQVLAVCVVLALPMAFFMAKVAAPRARRGRRWRSPPSSAALPARGRRS